MHSDGGEQPVQDLAYGVPELHCVLDDADVLNDRAWEALKQPGVMAVG